MCTSDVYDAVAQGSGALKHGQTYNAHPVGCAAALAVQQVIRDEGLLGRVAGRGRAAADVADGSASATIRNVGDIRGRGLLLALELVADRADEGAVRSRARDCTSAPRPKRSPAAC